MEFTPAQWPGLHPAQLIYANYTEGLFVGYRWYDAHNVKFTTGFPFGHGLSYTTFAYPTSVSTPRSPLCEHHCHHCQHRHCGRAEGLSLPELPHSAQEPCRCSASPC